MLVSYNYITLRFAIMINCFWFQILSSFFYPSGPAHWAKNYDAAKGKRQSPIDIVTKATKPSTSLSDLCISYDPSRCTGITNNGHTFTVKVEERQTSE